MNKIMDYMFFGCPIVAFDLKENGFSAQDAAVYVTLNSEEQMAAAIEILLADDRRRQVTGTYAKARASAFLWENPIPQLLCAYDDLLKGKTKPLEQPDPSALR